LTDHCDTQHGSIDEECTVCICRGGWQGPFCNRSSIRPFRFRAFSFTISDSIRSDFCCRQYLDQFRHSKHPHFVIHILSVSSPAECRINCVGNQTANFSCEQCKCPTGFELDEEVGCRDVDECATDNGGCDALTACRNIVGGRKCGACPGWHFGSGYDKCFEKKFVSMVVAVFVLMVSTLIFCHSK
jgi:hypothetical protein